MIKEKKCNCGEQAAVMEVLTRDGEHDSYACADCFEHNNWEYGQKFKHI